MINDDGTRNKKTFQYCCNERQHNGRTGNDEQICQLFTPTHTDTYKKSEENETQTFLTPSIRSLVFGGL